MADAAEPRPSESGPEVLPLPHPPKAGGSDLHRLLRWLPALAWMGLIYWLSSQPQLPRLPEPLWQTLMAKTVHLGEYAVLALLLLVALATVAGTWPRGSNGHVPRRYLLVLALAVLYAASDEWHQSFVPNRTASALDVLIDAAGALAALWVVARTQTWRRERPPPP